MADPRNWPAPFLSQDTKSQPPCRPGGAMGLGPSQCDQGPRTCRSSLEVHIPLCCWLPSPPSAEQWAQSRLMAPRTSASSPGLTPPSPASPCATSLHSAAEAVPSFPLSLDGRGETCRGLKCICLFLLPLGSFNYPEAMPEPACWHLREPRHITQPTPRHTNQPPRTCGQNRDQRAAQPGPICIADSHNPAKYMFIYFLINFMQQSCVTR